MKTVNAKPVKFGSVAGACNWRSWVACDLQALPLRCAPS